MKKRTKTKTNILCRAFAVFELACLAFIQHAQAVSPVPDGGYPGGNTAEGQNALFSLSSGTYNTALGFSSLRSNTTGNLNTAIGAGTLLLNTGAERVTSNSRMPHLRQPRRWRSEPSVGAHTGRPPLSPHANPDNDQARRQHDEPP